MSAARLRNACTCMRTYTKPRECSRCFAQNVAICVTSVVTAVIEAMAWRSPSATTLPRKPLLAAVHRCSSVPVSRAAMRRADGCVAGLVMEEASVDAAVRRSSWRRPASAARQSALHRASWAMQLPHCVEASE